MTTLRPDNIGHFIRDANAMANVIDGPQCVGWDTVNKTWRVYNPVYGAPVDVEPELMCFGQGQVPMPLTPVAVDVWTSLVLAMLEPIKTLAQ